MSEDKYLKRGVSASKSEVHTAIKQLDKGLFPNAFCKILPDVAGNDPEYCNVMHADTAGTKTSAAYIYWKETGDLSVWKGIAQDAIVMNLDDMACVGCLDNILLSSTIGRNKMLITGEVIAAIIEGAVELLDMLRSFGVRVELAGGETADVGDIVRTIDVGYTAFARMPKDQLIVNNIKSGDVVVGLASDGMSSYEKKYNSGMGSNGLTAARHEMLKHSYAEKYPESYDPNMPKDLIYEGKFDVNDIVTFENDDITIGQLLLSPTRTYLPVLKVILDNLRSHIHGIIHCTGGGQTKVKKFATKKKIVKNNLFPTPELFSLIQDSTKMEWREMYQVFNMGHRMEFYCDNHTAREIIEISESFNIPAQIVGFVEQRSEGTEVEIRSNYGTFIY